MRTRRRLYTAATPASLIPEALTVNPIGISLPVSDTRRKNLQSGNDRSKKKKKCNRLWDLTIPSEILQEIFSRLGLKANIEASVVCKAWCEAAVSVRKSKPRPWLFYPQDGTGSTYILADPLGSQTQELNFPELKKHRFCYSTDGWLLVTTEFSLFFLNPFTLEKIHLPGKPTYFSPYCLAFSAAPTSTSCVVISYVQPSYRTYIEINTWRPGSTVWTNHRFENQSPDHEWVKSVFSNGILYCLSICGNLGVFDPSRETWNVLQVEQLCPTFKLYQDFSRQVLMMEHEGDIFVMYTPGDNKKNNPLVLKLNLTRRVWEEKRELGGLTVFASYCGSVARAGLSTEERNRIYPLNFIRVKPHDMYYYSLGGDEKSSNPPSQTFYSGRVAWVDPPLDNNT